MIEDNQNDLNERLKAARAEFEKDYNPNSDSKKARSGESINDGAKAGIELVGAIAGGALLGLGIDHLFDTSPTAFFICLILGVITGFYNVYKITMGLGTSVGFIQLHSGKKTAKQNANLDQENTENKG